MHADSIHLKWLFILIVTIFPSILGTLIPVTVAEWPKNPRRAHHQAKLWNEVLAKHQFAYIGYFFAIIFTGNLPAASGSWIPYLVYLGVLLAFAFYFFGVFSYVYNHERIITQRHNGHVCPGANCRLLGFIGFFKLCGWKLLGVIILACIAVFAAFWTESPTLPKAPSAQQKTISMLIKNQPRINANGAKARKPTAQALANGW